MHLVTRRKGSQRRANSIPITFEPNFSGQGGVPFMTLIGEDDKYYMIHFDGIEEARQLLSHAHIVWANVCEEEALNTLKELHGVRPKAEGN